MAEKREHPLEVDDLDLYTIVIYQNTPFVEGLYQQFIGGRPTQMQTNDQSDVTDGLKGIADVGGSIPGIVNLKGSGEGSRQSKSATGSATTMTFDHAYLLHGVRQALREKDLVTVVDDPAAYQGLKPGDFVEYRATFEPNFIVSVLDVLTADIVQKYAYASNLKEAISPEMTPEELQHANNEATLSSNQAAAIFEAAQREFRNGTSLEFYGKVVPAPGAESLNVHAVTVCDRAMFSGGDTDKLVDGEFRVLGKVIRVMNYGYTLMDRNKILSRLKDNALDELQEKLRADERVAEYINLDLGLKEDAAAFKVIPITVFV
ncbi:DUF6414 family protein [Pseudarthrobacter polychromogenes]|uniref:Major capsid protein n=1 Tax=Pseudarthrobacter polychromogenes TaxID=1676 RepID=A0ABQ1Y1Q2_9MICC|nr:hypothetical protein [Pseudarthrobacter polychromogenes]GGH09353.1 hypothetical protein GCM10011577_37660 [Pseudarthrobacter polychromogenes]